MKKSIFVVIAMLLAVQGCTINLPSAGHDSYTHNSHTHTHAASDSAEGHRGTEGAVGVAAPEDPEQPEPVAGDVNASAMSRSALPPGALSPQETPAAPLLPKIVDSKVGSFILHAGKGAVFHCIISGNCW